MTDQPVLLYIDLFCGAGGTTIGVEAAKIRNHKVAKVIAAVNHDLKAIESHQANHGETVHFQENIKKLNVRKIEVILNKYRVLYPHSKIVLWASLECTNHSKAKGGKPKNADSRSLAWYLPRYIKILKPDYIQIENVVEFMAWGPVDENGKPISRKNGQSFLKWREYICNTFGYRDEWREMDSANFGAYTKRNRLFGIFAKEGLPIVFPEITHVKEPGGELFGKQLQKFKAVREVLELESVGSSIFGRKKPLVENTLRRIYAGLVKFVANGDDTFIQNYYSAVDPSSKVTSLDNPAATITTIPHQGIVFIQKYYSGNDAHRCKSVDVPCDVVTTNNRHSLVQTEFLCQTYAANSKGDNVFSANKPSRTITTRDATTLIQPSFLIKYFGASTANDINSPASTLTTKDRLAYCSLDTTVPQFSRYELEEGTHRQFLMNPQYKSKGSSIEKPCFTLIAQMEKCPPYLITTEHGELSIAIYDTDSEYMQKIKFFMAHYGIIDIKTRMLFVSELKKIQGFPNDYILLGSQEDQKKFIGNAVVPLVTQHWTVSLAQALINQYN